MSRLAATRPRGASHPRSPYTRMLTSHVAFSLIARGGVARHSDVVRGVVHRVVSTLY